PTKGPTDSLSRHNAGGGEDPKRIWKLARLRPDRAGILWDHQEERQDSTEVEEKAELFREQCFPPPPQADLTDVENFRYRAQLPNEDEAAEEEMLWAVGKTKPDETRAPMASQTEWRSW
ncbi:hypothetical protein LTR93_011883, partial [Exophiala xenobiotica]